MKHFLNTLFVTTEKAYASLDGDNIVLKLEESELARFPLHTLEGIHLFTYAGASPSLMGACAKRNINLCFLTPSGRFLARTNGESSGNVLLRRTQYRLADNPSQSLSIAKNILYGKVYNARWNLDRTLRDHSMRIDAAKLEQHCALLQGRLPQLREAPSLEILRGLEGEAASVYFGGFDDMILTAKEAFYFHGRTRRPPLDNVNALLSFMYSILANDCAGALEAVGLDAYVGFLHRDRPGRESLALDLMEELRACYVDRFVVTLINNRVISGDDFEKRENGAVQIYDSARKSILKSWQEKKRQEIMHPFLKQKISWGLVPHVQALLLARFLRGDLDEYPPFLWK